MVRRTVPRTPGIGDTEANRHLYGPCHPLPFVRIGPEAITSENITRSRYSVHLSADHHNLLIVADANGNVLCIQNTLTLSGLDTILPFNGKTELSCTYSPSFNGLIVSLN